MSGLPHSSSLFCMCCQARSCCPIQVLQQAGRVRRRPAPAASLHGPCHLSSTQAGEPWQQHSAALASPAAAGSRHLHHAHAPASTSYMSCTVRSCAKLCSIASQSCPTTAYQQHSLPAAHLTTTACQHSIAPALPFPAVPAARRSSTSARCPSHGAARASGQAAGSSSLGEVAGGAGAQAGRATLWAASWAGWRRAQLPL